jgi:hypothetical protein
MKTIRQILRVPKNHEIKIKVPQDIPENEIAEVILIIKKKPLVNFKDKINTLKEAMNDELFLNDLADVSNDFSGVDLEKWE